MNLPFSILNLGAIGIGAVLGAWTRYGLGLWLNQGGRALPLGTLVANIVGGLLIGLAIGWLGRLPAIDPAWRLFVVTGFLGALTTFSAFSLEAVTLLSRGQTGWAIAHSVLHLVGSIGAAAVGLRLANA
ncbi:MAG: fluoride efflux transporter CrcB [Burkholderiaceae bacterium]